MSWVTNVMLSVQSDDRQNAADFAKLVEEKPWLHLDRKKWPQIPDPWPEDQQWMGPYNAGLEESPISVWPGSKAPECHVWLGVLNNSDPSRFRALLISIPWRLPNAVQLMLMDQEEQYFRLWMFRDGELKQFAPTEPDDGTDAFWDQDPRLPDRQV